MQQSEKRIVIRRANPKTGVAEVGVLLSNRRDRAWTTAEAYELIVVRYGPRTWFLNDNGQGRNYVRLVPAGGRWQPVMVSRLVMGVQPRKVIKYRDGDRLNLRPENLVIASSYRPQNTRRRMGRIEAAPMVGVAA